MMPPSDDAPMRDRCAAVLSAASAAYAVSARVRRLEDALAGYAEAAAKAEGAWNSAADAYAIAVAGKGSEGLAAKLDAAINAERAARTAYEGAVAPAMRRCGAGVQAAEESAANVRRAEGRPVDADKRCQV